ncbi:PP2C family serine/threonine-protein phosphatase [Massilia sp. METH4]|uniref:PP2C family protein-serine/threonine phosphatase n=1 Tax=Massilia sp. METH4 TaxID=3123041 RepID=UPI0030CE1684
MRFSVYQESHVGGRDMNQDRMGYCYTRDALLLVLADGMGGHPHGEVAATVALEAISALFRQQAGPYVKGPARFLEDACHAAHREIHRHAVVHGLADVPRTTIVACLVQHGSATWAHCGDSRLYLLRGGRVLARTRDHSHVEKLIGADLVPASARLAHPDRNKLYNCLGAARPPLVELSPPARLEAGDVMLLCSDGLWAALPEEQLVATLSTGALASAVPGLLRAALRNAGPGGDNATGLAIAWQEGPDVPGAGSTIVCTESAPGPLAGAADPFDEAEIERAIAEIRAAIDKSSQLL